MQDIAHVEKYFLLGANDAFDCNERRLAAYDVVNAWLERLAWPVYANTKNRKAFEARARVILYVGGHKQFAQTFIGSATIGGVRVANTADRSRMPQGERAPSLIIEFSEVSLFATPISIRPLISQLELFDKTRSRWGLALVGGARRISQRDFDIVMKAASHPNHRRVD